MHYSVLKFFFHVTSANCLKNHRILEIGSYNVNGSVRPIIEATMGPVTYTGIDMREGPCVDLVLSAEQVAAHFGAEQFDAVICFEALEHIKDWKAAISNMKTVLKSGGTLYLTTRSKGFPLHSYPDDYWRFEVADMKTIFNDFVTQVYLDPDWPGVFVHAMKPLGWMPALDLTNYSVYSMENEK
jgi:SAM-dependent methyltransferase